MLSTRLITAAVLLAATVTAKHLPVYDRQLFMRSKTASPDQSALRTCGDTNDKKVEELARLAAAVCLNCHELNSHRNPNYNYQCSKDCYQNETFRNCLNAFMGDGKSRPSKRSRTGLSARHVRLLETLFVPGYF